MCLIARQLEAAGIATTSLTVARDITAAGRPPRAAFVDFPLGHTAGRVHDPATGRALVEAALALAHDPTPEQLVDLGLRWADDDSWKDSVFRAVVDAETGEVRRIDDRTPRVPDPVFQQGDDAARAAETHADATCAVCAGLDY